MPAGNEAVVEAVGVRHWGNARWYPWYIAGVLALAQAMSIIDRYLMNLVVEPVKGDFLLTDTQLGLLTGTSFVVLFALLGIPLGRLADIASRRLIIFVGICAWSVATLSCAFTDSFWELFTARVAVGVGEAALLPSAMSLIAAYFVKENRTRGMAIYAMGSSLGRGTAFIGGGFLFGVLVAQGGLILPGLPVFKPWQGVFVIGGIVGFAVAALCLTIREPPRNKTSSASRRFSESIGYFLKHRYVYARFFVAFALMMAVVMALGGWMISYYAREHGLPVSQASMLLGVTSMLVGPLGALFGGWLTDRMIRRGVIAAPAVTIAGALAIAPIAGLALCLSASLWPAIVAYLALYFALSATGPAGFNGVQLITPEQHRGFISSVFQLSFIVIGTGVGPLMVGLVSDYMFRSEAMIEWSLAVSFLLFALIGIPAALWKRAHYQAVADRVY